MTGLTAKPDPRTSDQLASESFLETEVRCIMTPGVVTIAESASLREVLEALSVHRVHSILVLGQTTGSPLGWVTARGMRNWLTHDPDLVSARNAITHEPARIHPSATAREALTALGQPGISQLLVAERPEGAAEGVLSDLDLVALAARR
jgi:CBS domain-containing protein